MSAYVSLDGLTKRFGALTVLDRVSLEIAEGETLVLLGPSGSGKTTLLRAIAGFETLDEGSIRVGGEDLTDLPPALREFGMVFQHYALFPHMSVAQNVAFGLESRGIVGAPARDRVQKALDLVELSSFGSRPVDQISGGQQQRVALARALAPEPRVLLLDEPLSNLDPALRERTRQQIREAVRSVGITAVWVTHEQEEAFDVGDRVAVLHAGELQQVGRPEALYLQPRTPFVARFVGRGSAIAGTWGGESAVEVDAGDGASTTWPASGGDSLTVGERVSVYFRPEGLALVNPDQADAVRGRVVERRYTGATTLYLVSSEGDATFEVAAEVDSARVGDRVGIVPRPGGPSGIAFGSGSESDE